MAAQRGEWEWPIEQDTPDLGRLAETPAGTIAGDLAGQELEPVFVTDIRRTVRRAARRRGYHGRGGAGRGDDHGRRRERGGERARVRAAGRGRSPRSTAWPSTCTRRCRWRSIPRARPIAATACGRGVRPAATKAPESGPGPRHRRARRRSGRSSRRGSVTSWPTSPQLPLATRKACTRCGSRSGGCAPRWCSSRRTSSRIRQGGSRPSSSASARYWARPATGTSSAWTPYPRRWTTRRVPSWGHLLLKAAEEKRQAAHRRVEEEIGSPALTGFVLGMAAWAEDGSTRPALLGDKRMRRRLAQARPRAARSARGQGREARQAHRAAVGRGAARAAQVTEEAALRRGRCGRPLRPQGGQGVPEGVQGAAGAPRQDERRRRGGHAGGGAERDDGSGLAPAAGALAQWSEKRRDKALHHLSGAWATFQKASPFWS